MNVIFMDFEALRGFNLLETSRLFHASRPLLDRRCAAWETKRSTWATAAGIGRSLVAIAAWNCVRIS